MNAILTKLFTLGVLFAPYLTGCNDAVPNDLQSGMLVDMTGLDGCSWMIETETNGQTKRLEPINLSAFALTPKDSFKIAFSYKPADVATICMAGEVIELTALEAR